MYGSWDMMHDRPTEGRTDGQKKWHIEVGVQPNNLVKQL